MFRSDPSRIRGSIAPVVSPFTADGAADTDGLRGLIRWQLESGSHGISLGGSTGEPSAQSTAERAAAIRAAADEIGAVLHVAGRDTLVWSGIELLCLPLLSLGGAGFVSATANLAPRAVARMYEHKAAGELEEARDLHFALHPVTDVIFTETNPAAAKWVLAQAGLIGSGFVRPPLVPLAEAGQATALRLLAAGAPVLDGPVLAITGAKVTA